MTTHFRNFEKFCVATNKLVRAAPSNHVFILEYFEPKTHLNNPWQYVRFLRNQHVDDSPRLNFDLTEVKDQCVLTLAHRFDSIYAHFPRFASLYTVDQDHHGRVWFKLKYDV